MKNEILKVERMFKNLAKNRRAISVAISSVIMAAAVISVGIAVVAWTNSTFAQQQSETGEFFSSEGQRMREKFVIEDVWFNPSPRYVDVTVRNVGSVNMTIDRISFDGTNRLASPQNIMNGTAATIRIDWDWGSTSHVYITVASLRGNYVRDYYSTTG
jgi:archaellum component FlaF (FlaF/FlaG flagellin family)